MASPCERRKGLSGRSPHCPYECLRAPRGVASATTHSGLEGKLLELGSARQPCLGAYQSTTAIELAPAGSLVPRKKNPRTIPSTGCSPSRKPQNGPTMRGADDLTPHSQLRESSSGCGVVPVAPCRGLVVTPSPAKSASSSFSSGPRAACMSKRAGHEYPGSPSPPPSDRRANPARRRPSPAGG